VAFLVSAALSLLAALPGHSDPARRWAIVAEGSELRWDLPATLHTVHGTAPRLSGAIELEPAAGSRADRAAEMWRTRVRVVVDAGAMVTGNSSRDRKMRETTLDTSRHPEIVFESRSGEADLARFRPGEHLTVEVAGDLTVRGRSEPLRLPVDVFVFEDSVTLSGSFSVAWKRFGLPDPSFGIITVREPVRVTFRMRAVPERSPRSGRR